MKLTEQQKVALEALVDTSTVYDVVSALAEICAEKGRHIVESYQDRATAGHWYRASNVLESIDSKLSRHDIAV